MALLWAASARLAIRDTPQKLTFSTAFAILSLKGDGRCAGDGGAGAPALARKSGLFAEPAHGRGLLYSAAFSDPGDAEHSRCDRTGGAGLADRFLPRLSAWLCQPGGADPRLDAPDRGRGRADGGIRSAGGYAVSSRRGGGHQRDHGLAGDGVLRPTPPVAPAGGGQAAGAVHPCGAESERRSAAHSLESGDGGGAAADAGADACGSGTGLVGAKNRGGAESQPLPAPRAVQGRL